MIKLHFLDLSMATTIFLVFLDENVPVATTQSNVRRIPAPIAHIQRYEIQNMCLNGHVYGAQKNDKVPGELIKRPRITPQYLSP